ncbi:unnamed protein product [Caenorhabditis angaria]|uniref:Uncharacterized protein n=1 Tax=Caenorhabditis angaria TaxID=860376 RepID=A0A9P1N7E6_9PELO|nr:unnamed protein product [Caenorhabditis angaria]
MPSTHLKQKRRRSSSPRDSRIHRSRREEREKEKENQQEIEEGEIVDISEDEVETQELLPMVQPIENDPTIIELSIISEQPMNRFCLARCPADHRFKEFQFYVSITGITRIICNCAFNDRLIKTRVFSSLTKEIYLENQKHLDLRPYRLELMENIRFVDPTLHVPLFVPAGMRSNEVTQPFYGDDIFQPCTNEHNHKNMVFCMHVRGCQTIVVCQCQDVLCFEYPKQFSKHILDMYDQKTVFKYANPQRRNFEAIPELGYIVL